MLRIKWSIVDFLISLDSSSDYERCLMRGRSKVMATVIAAAAILGPVITDRAATAVPLAGGCYGGHLATTNIAGTGSAGISTSLYGSLTGCASPQLPGVVAGTLNLSYPFTLGFGSSDGGGPAIGTIVWSNGAVSAVSGNWVPAPVSYNSTSILNIYRGPGTGGRLQIIARQTIATGSWFGGSGSIVIINATFIP